MAKNYIGHTVLMLLLFLGGSVISTSLTLIAQSQPTPTPQAEAGHAIFHPLPNFFDTFTHDDVVQIGVALQTRLGMWDLPSSVTINARDDILVGITSIENPNFILQSITQRGLIELIHLSDVIGAPSLLAMLDQPILPEHYAIPFSGDVFRSVQVEMNTPSNWSVIFDYAPEVEVQHQQFVEDYPADFFGVVVDEVLWSVISVAGTRISGLSEQNARVLAAYMQSGPLPLLLE